MNHNLRTFRKGWRYFYNAVRLLCPTCGISPIFVPFKKTRSLRDWFTPLDGCPRCGYAYEREPGYFLLAIWAINYGIGSLLGLALYLFLEWRYQLNIWVLMGVVITPVILFNLFFARHSKAFFLALDHFFDNHERHFYSNPDDESPDQPAPVAPTGRSTSPGLPLKKKVQETSLL